MHCFWRGASEARSRSCPAWRFAHSGGRVLALGAVGALLACAFQITVVSGELADPVQHELLNAACLANALGWLAGTLLVARVRVLEYLDAQEAT